MLAVGVLEIAISFKAKQKNMCDPGYMFLKIRVGRQDYFFIFLKKFYLPAIPFSLSRGVMARCSFIFIG